MAQEARLGAKLVLQELTVELDVLGGIANQGTQVAIGEARQARFKIAAWKRGGVDKRWWRGHAHGRQDAETLDWELGKESFEELRGLQDELKAENGLDRRLGGRQGKDVVLWKQGLNEPSPVSASSKGEEGCEDGNEMGRGTDGCGPRCELGTALAVLGGGLLRERTFGGGLVAKTSEEEANVVVEGLGKTVADCDSIADDAIALGQKRHGEGQARGVRKVRIKGERNEACGLPWLE